MNDKFTDAQIVEFLRRSYMAVDGLWFVKTEERHGSDEAMEMDEIVWTIMPKIQARKAREILEITGDSIQDLIRAFHLKSVSEGHDFEIEEKDGEINLMMHKCTWYEMLKASGRTHLAETIADRICVTEIAGWCKEFSPDIEFELRQRQCTDGCETCLIAFKNKD